MFSTVLEELKGYLGATFLFSAYFPLLLFVSLSLAIGLESTIGLGNAFAQWAKLESLSQTLLLVGGLIAVAALAYLVRNFQYGIVRLFEGYGWNGPLLTPLRMARIAYHKARARELDDQMQRAYVANDLDVVRERAFELLTYYPPLFHLDLFLPTQIGNILRASEVYALDRYQLDSVVMWPRFRAVLKEDAAALDDGRVALDSLLLLTALSALFTLIWCTLLVAFTDRVDLFLLCALGWPLAWLCYSNAVQSAVAYGEEIKAAFDVHRHDLLKALDWEVPKALNEEKAAWNALTEFFYQNKIDETYFNPPTPGGHP